MISDQPTQHHAVEGTDEETIDKLLVKDRHPNNSSNEVEKLEMMFVVKTGVRIDLESVHIIGRVLEQSVVRIEQFGGDQLEPFSRHSTVIQTFLSSEFYPKFGFQYFVILHFLNFSEGIFHHHIPPDFDFGFQAAFL